MTHPIKLMIIRLTLSTLALLISVFSTPSFAQDFSWKNLALLHAKLTPEFDYEAHLNDYMRVFASGDWRRLKRYPEQFERIRSTQLAAFKQAVAEYDINDPMDIKTQESMSPYQVEQGAFGFLEPINTRTFYYKTADQDDTENLTHFPKQFKVYFTNPDTIRNLYTSTRDAKRITKINKTKTGVLRIGLHLSARVAQLKPNTPNAFEGLIVKQAFLPY